MSFDQLRVPNDWLGNNVAQAHSVPGRYYLLLNTVQGSKLEVPSGFMGILSHRANVVIAQGALLLADSRPGPFSYMLYNDPQVGVRCSDADVTLLDLPGLQMLEGIQKLDTRITVLQSGQLAFGRDLVPGSKVAIAMAKTRTGYAIGTVRFKGTVGNRPGITFGLELVDKECKYGDTDGTFQGMSYFRCPMGYGMFVSLDLLVPLKGENYRAQKPHSNNSAPSHMEIQPGQVKAIAISSHFQVHDRARVTDVKGGHVEGTVKWIGKSLIHGYTILGIKTDKKINDEDFPYKITGLNHTIPAPTNQSLFLPESLAENLTTENNSKGEISGKGSPGKSPQRNTGRSQDVVNTTEYTKQLEEFRKVLREAGEDTSTLEEQLKELLRMEGKYVDENVPRKNEHDDECRDNTDSKKVAEPPNDHPSSEHHVNKHKEKSRSMWRKIHFGTMGKKDHLEEDKSLDSLLATCSLQETRQLTEEKVFNCSTRDGNPASAPLPPSLSPNHVVRPAKKGTSEALKIGSRVQLPSSEPNKMAYGVIKWIGTIPNEREQMSGIAMEECVNGYSDGSWKDSEGHIHQFFRCPPGKGLYYQLDRLQPDQRIFDTAYWEDKIKEIEGTFLSKIHAMESEFYTRLQEMKSAHQIKHDEIERLQNDIRTKDTELLNMKSVLHFMQEDITELKSIINRKDFDIQERNQLISSRRSETEGLTATIRAKDEDIIGLQDELKQNDVTIRRLENTLETLQLQQQRDDHRQDDTSPRWTNLHTSTAPWKIKRSELKKVSKIRIGAGAWGVVYTSQFKGERVAIKQAHHEILQMDEIVDMIKREISIMAHIQHPNLVRLIGAVLDESVEARTEAPIIVLELLDLNLREAYKFERLERSIMVSIFCDVAYALHYLHEQSSPIIHRDVSAPNVLLKKLPNGLFRAKVSDFGSANLVKRSRTAGAGAIIYTAPEMFPQEDVSVSQPEQTVKVDVFSYGILLLEVICKELPTLEKRASQLRSCKKHWEKSYDLVMECTKRVPTDRPSMRQILKTLNWTRFL